MPLNSCICIMSDANKIVSVHGMYEHATGNLNYRYRLELIKMEEHTHLMSTQLNTTILKDTQNTQT